MKRKYFKSIILTSLVTGYLLTGCNSNPVRPDSKGSKKDYEINYYDNNSFNDWVTNNASSIKGQWENFGIHSPYILKFNGVYYLYASTSFRGNDSGVRAWKSYDLVNWEPVTGKGLKTGYVVAHTEGASLNARAPEVYYYNGYFYMYESYNKGKGHFVLRSDSPEGPFTSLTNGVLDSMYDGTLVFDKDENPYFITANKGNINISSLEGMGSIINTKLPIEGTYGSTNYDSTSPTVFDHLGKYYLLYSYSYETLNSTSIKYAVSDGWDNETPNGLAASFRKGATDVIMMNANKNNGFTGLAHPSVFLGPDLDSHYVAYDCLDSVNENHRSFNFDRLFVDGDMVTANHNRYQSIQPKMPEFMTYGIDGLKQENEFMLSEEKSEDTFSAEFNFRNPQNAQLVFAYQDSNNYAYLKVNMESSIALHQKKNGEDKLLKEIEFYNAFHNYDLHNVRINYRDQKLDLHFENSLKLSNFDIDLKGGKIGYHMSSDLDINYTCFSNVARGLSDQLEAKQSSLDIPANVYLPAGYNKDSSSYLFNGSSGIQYVSQNDYKNAGGLLLDKQYDYARYLVNFNKSANYGVEFTLPYTALGKKIIMEIDDEEDIELTIPEMDNLNQDFVRVKVGNISFNRGVHQIKIQSNDSYFAFISFKFIENTANYSLLASLANESECRGLQFGDDSKWTFSNGGLTCGDDQRSYAYIEEDHISDFQISFDLSLTGKTGVFFASKEAGVLFRSNNYTSFNYYVDNITDVKMWNTRFDYVQGYFLGIAFDKITLHKYDNDPDKSEALETIKYSFGGKKEHNVILKVRGSEFDLFIDKEYIHTFKDAKTLTSGGIGLYTSGAEALYKNLKIQTA